MEPPFFPFFKVVRLPPSEQEEEEIMPRTSLRVKVRGSYHLLLRYYGLMGDDEIKKEVDSFGFMGALGSTSWHEILNKENGFFDTAFLEVKLDLWFRENDPSDDE